MSREQRGRVLGYVLAFHDSDPIADGKIVNQPLVFPSAEAARRKGGDKVTSGRLIVVELHEVVSDQ